jgi:hypothetical protein
MSSFTYSKRGKLNMELKKICVYIIEGHRLMEKFA